MAGTISIAGAVVKTPKSFVVGLQDIDNDSSGRNANGKMVRDVIAKKVKLDIEWGPLSDSEASTILSRINGSFFLLIILIHWLADKSQKLFMQATEQFQVIHGTININQ